jgi:hypothetical protein
MLGKVLRVLMGASIAGALVVSASTQASATIDTTRVSTTIVGVGSDTTYEGMSDLDLLYNESPGCGILPTTGTPFTNYLQKCIIGGLQAYDGPVITTENLYHDRVVEAFPVGSGNGASVLTQYTEGNPAVAGDFTRSSSKRTLTAVPNFTTYGVAFARDGLGYWLGKNNTSVAHNTKGPLAKVSVADLKGVFIGGGAPNTCQINYSASATDSIASTLGAPGAGTIKVFATQPGSGTGKDFLGKIDPAGSYSDATALQNCIPATFKDGLPNPSDHVIFENNAKPICNQTGSGGAPISYQKNGIFPYSFARYTQNAAGTGACIGKLGAVGGVAINLTTIGDSSYPLGRYVYNNFYVPTSMDVNDSSTWTGQTQAMLDYLHPVTGWLCEATHSANPVSGINYRTLIETKMEADGFAPLTLGPVLGSTFTGTSYCRDGANT